LLAGDEGVGGAGEHQVGLAASEVDPLQLTRGEPQAAANFHSEQFVEVDGALHVGGMRHGDEACDFGGHGDGQRTV